MSILIGDRYAIRRITYIINPFSEHKHTTCEIQRLKFLLINLGGGEGQYIFYQTSSLSNKSQNLVTINITVVIYN